MPKQREMHWKRTFKIVDTALEFSFTTTTMKTEIPKFGI